MAAETATNPIDSTMLAVETPINIDTTIRMLNPEDVPMLGGVNSDGYPLVARKPVDQTVFYWLEDEFLAPRTTLATALPDGTGTAVVVATDNGERFAAGDLIRIQNECMLITGVGGTGNDTLTVTRGAAGTTGAAHTVVGTEIIGMGTMLAEGSIGDEQFTGRTKLFNYTKIWTSKIAITRTGRMISKYGMPGGELPRQTNKVVFAEAVNMEQTLLYGPRYQSGNVRHTGGLSTFVTNTISNASSGNWLTVNEIETRQQARYDAGGSFSDIIANARAFAALNNISSDRITYQEMTDSRRGRAGAMHVITAFGEVVLHRNRYVMATDAFGINPSDIIYRVFTPWTMSPLAKTDDKDNFMFVAEGGFQIINTRYAVRWIGLDTTAAFPAGLV